jgi:hypothetical protein
MASEQRSAPHLKQLQFSHHPNISSLCDVNRHAFIDDASCRGGRTYRELGDEETFLRLMIATTFRLTADIN